MSSYAFGMYRHDIRDHQAVFGALVTLTQLAIENGEPLFHVEYDGCVAWNLHLIWNVSFYFNYFFFSIVKSAILNVAWPM